MDVKYVLHRRLVDSNLKSAQLENALSSWLNYPSNVQFTGRHSKGKKVVTYTVDFLRQPDYVGWGIRLGELAHSLRSSLDNATFNISSVGTNRIEFPIFDDEQKYTKEVGKKLNGISEPTILQYIKNKQPFNRPDPTSDPLWLLHRINNIDKHRLPNIILFHPTSIELSFSATFRDRNCVPVVAFNDKPVQSGVWFMKYKFRYPFETFKDNSNFTMQARIEIDGKNFSIKEVCEWMVSEVNEIVKYLGAQTPDGVGTGI